MRRLDGLKRYQYAVCALLALALLVAGRAPARPTSIVTAIETGGDVVFSGSGTIDLTAWSFSFTTILQGGSLGNLGFLVGPAVSTAIDLFGFGGAPLNYSGPSSIGPVLCSRLCWPGTLHRRKRTLMRWRLMR